jgi:hypothetical protein
MVKKLNEIKTIGEGTAIVFSMKEFFGLFISIFAILFGFYQLVIEPKVASVETQYIKLTDQNEKEHQHLMYGLENINKSIFAIKLNVQELQLSKGIKPISLDKSNKLFEQTYIQETDTNSLYKPLTKLDDFQQSAYGLSKKN